MRACLELERLLRQFTKKAGLPWPDKVIIEPPKYKHFGNLTTNLTMVLAKETKRNPRELAGQAREFLLAHSYELASVEVAGPGFLNCIFGPAFWHATIPDVLATGENYGSVDVGRNKRVQVEFVSANPTGPLHIGHGRGAAIGDSLARILRFTGHKVSCEYYLNDVGHQMWLLGLSVWVRLQQRLGRDVILPENCYQGDYITDIASDLLATRPELADWPKERKTEAIDTCRLFATHAILEGINRDLTNFRVTHDVWFSEQSLLDTGAVDKTLEWLMAAGLTFDEGGALWFRTIELGDDKNRVLRKSDGSLTYFATDIAYHADKFDRGFEQVVNIWGADHHGYIPRMQAAITALGRPTGSLKIILVQLVNLLTDDKSISMSTRTGTFRTLADVCHEVGTDAARFVFLLRKSDSKLDFDLELTKRKSMDNPVYYVQYAHARICSMQRKARKLGNNLVLQASVELDRLDTDEDLELLRLLERFPETCATAAELLAPHHISHYLLELATMLHRYYAVNPVLAAKDRGLTIARLTLMATVARVLKNGLGLLGVTAPDKM
ncbi:Arginine--tRNA ligase [Desulfovibrionales bacterium]